MRTLWRWVTIPFALTGLAGCRAGGVPLINLLGLEKPVVVGLVADRAPALGDNPLDLLNPFAPYEPMRKAMSKSTGRPVALDLCLEPLLEPNLRLKVYDFAIISPAQYAHLHDPERYAVVAVSSDERKRVARPGVLVVASNSGIQKVEDLRGKRVAFGPSRDARTHGCGLALLEEHGIHRGELSLEVLPVPGALKVFNNGRSVAQCVINSSAEAGFVDEAVWDSFPEHDNRPDEPARDKLREIARTHGVPDRLVIASSKPDANTTEKLALFLTSDAARATAPENQRGSGYERPSAEVLAACLRGRSAEDEEAEPASNPN